LDNKSDILVLISSASILSGLMKVFRTRRADLDRDRKYSVSEFRAYISERVTKLSNGSQIPTSREENIMIAPCKSVRWGFIRRTNINK